jgi:hypothetical protein
MSRVAIIGSCISRDLWPIRGDTDGLIYVSRTSLASLFAKPVKGFRPAGDPPGKLGRYQHRALVSDLQKTAIGRLVAFRPTHLIFDFIDERFGLLALDGAIVTHSYELEVSGYLKGKAFRNRRDIPRLSDACERLWREGAAQMAALIRATPLQEAKLILHSARWAEQSQTGPLPTPEILPKRPENIAAHNALLASYEQAFETLMPPLARVEAPEHRIADDAHRWGLSPFHYVPAYYETIWEQLAALGVTRDLSGAGAAPSARAA